MAEEPTSSADAFVRPDLRPRSPLTVTFNVRKEDVLAMTLHYYACSPSIRRSRLITQASVPVAMILVAALGYFRDAGYRYLLLITPLLLIGLVWALLYPWLYSRYLSHGAEKLFKEASYEKACGAYKLTFSETRVESSSPLGEGTYVWSAVSCLSLTPEYFFIFLAGSEGYPIDRAQVPDDTILKVKAFVEEMISKPELSPSSR